MRVGTLRRRNADARLFWSHQSTCSKRVIMKAHSPSDIFGVKPHITTT